MAEHIKVTVNDEYVYRVNSDYMEYDATHAVAGALLAGAGEVSIERVGDND